MTSEFLYDELPKNGWIRLLHLQPGESEQALQCSLVSTSLEEAPQYEALSYTWGDPEATDTLICGHISVGITANLSDALRRLRLEKDVRIIWADAICINQQNIPEKEHQVGQMRAVYECASKVVIWAGLDPVGDIPLAFQHIRETNKYFDAELKEYGDIHAIPTVASDSPMLSVERWQATLTMFSLPWFSRVWVLQEVGLAATAVFYCGEHSIDWSDIVEYSMLATMRADLESVPVLIPWGRIVDPFLLLWCTFGTKKSWRFERRFINQIASASGNNARVHLLTVLFSGLAFDATDARDRIYAFLGHPGARVNNTALIEPNYTIDKDELYYSVALHLLRDMGDLVLLSTTDPKPDEKSSLPSWVPRWDVRRGTVYLSSFPGVYRFFNASKFPDVTKNEYLAEVSKGGVLKLRGLPIGSIDKCSTTMGVDTLIYASDDTFTNGMEQAFKDVDLQGALKKAPYSDALRAVALTMIVGQDAVGDPLPEDDADLRNGFRAYCYYMMTPDYCDNLFGETPSFEGDELKFLQEIRQHCNLRRFFVTQAGHFGVGPALMEPGDLCYVFIGASVPFIIRPVPDAETPRYVLVGECYIHRFMKGEAIDKWKNGENSLQDILLV